MLTSQDNSMSLHEARYMLMIYEQRIEHLSSASHINMSSPSANFISNNNNNNGGKLNVEKDQITMVEEDQLIEEEEAEEVFGITQKISLLVKSIGEKSFSCLLLQ
ncbi:hypothetical protein ACOSQ3_021585 [Xanthoceras sorbifolium]